MKAFLEYVVSNYTWLLSGTIIILLAIIGSYADKTNFGQGKSKETRNVGTGDLDLPQKKTLSDYFKKDESGELEKNSEDFLNSTLPDGMKNNVSKRKDIDNFNHEFNEIPLDKIKDDTSKNERYQDFESNFQSFDQEFNEILPEKDIIDDDLLNDIDDLSFDKTQKINIGDIPDLDDVELPEIKAVKSDDENIWDIKK